LGDWITGLKLGACRWISEVLAIELLALRAKCWQVKLVAGDAVRIIDTVLVVVLAFYMLLYGDRVWHGLINLLPSQIGIPLAFLTAKFSELLYQSVMLGLMVVTLTPIFLALKVPFALCCLLIGAAELIPYWGDPRDWSGDYFGSVSEWWLAIQAMFMQQIKDNLLAPRLMGNFTGLNPIWIFIALLMGAQIAGF